MVARFALNEEIGVRLPGEQPPRIKKIMDFQKKEVEYLDSMKLSIQDKGFEQPLRVRQDWSVYDGLHRLRVALDLGIEQIPVFVLTN